jgi:serine/threonine-protein kinase
MKTCPQCETGYPDSQTTCPTHGLPLNEIRDLKPGMVIHQSYRIVRKLGQGGMGAVYLAQHMLMDEPRALKFLSPELSCDAAFTGRFLREVRTLRQIRNRNVVDCGDLESAEDGSLFFSMEFVDGPDLRGLMHDTTGPFPVALALSIARQIAEGLGAAHAKGMVHRDIKPENILMARDAAAWLPKIADFGIVATKESSTAYTRTGGTLLTMAYAAPEQWRGTPAASLDGRTDLYALGGLLYEMLTGQTPFHAENYEGWSRHHQTTPPQPPSTLRPDLANWQGLDALVLRLLAKDRNDRPKDVVELLGLLDAVRHLPSDSRRETLAEYAGKRSDVNRKRRVPIWIWAASIVVIVVIVFAAVRVFAPQTSIQPTSTELQSRPQKTVDASTGLVPKVSDTANQQVPLPKPNTTPPNSTNFVENTSEIERKAETFEDQKRYSEAKSLYEQACTGGNGAACVNLGEMYFLGLGVAQDYSRAVVYYIKACDAGDSSGCYSPAHMYADGKFITEDNSRATELYTKGLSIDSKKCNAGDFILCILIAQDYENGNNGQPKDVGMAKQFYRKGCSMGSKRSCDNLKNLDSPETKSVSAEEAVKLTWTDPATGLMWTKKDNGSGLYHNEAWNYCQKLRLAGYNDWRLPMIDELQGIYDPNANVNGWHVKGNLQLKEWEWSGSRENTTGEAWSFAFSDGARDATMLGNSVTKRALCVRTVRK